MRILVIDDDPALHQAYRLALQPSRHERDVSLETLACELFGSTARGATPQEGEPVELTLVRQGAEGVACVEASHARDAPFQVVFIDIRMPPGIDGKETARRIRAIDPAINIVIVTAYSDHSATDIALVAGPADKIFYISKPFAAEEVRQIAIALSQRWNGDMRLRKAMTELAASEARALHAAGHDFLTGAPNRRAFHHELGEWLKRDGKPFAVALFDLDRFKHVNDTFGHGAGDALLLAVYRSARAALPEGAIVARLGGDEFAAMFEIRDAGAAHDQGRAILDCCSRHFSVMGHGVEISASLGFLVSSNHPNASPDELIRFADLALFEAKRRGKAQACMFDVAMDESSRFRRKIEQGLRSAVRDGELSAVYQPIVERESLRVAGFEALLRWTSREHGSISPAVFIPIAEEGPAIHEIGDWIIRRALADSRNWPNQYVSVNFSARQFQRPDLAAMLCRYADDARVPHERFQIEITETTIFENPELAAATLEQLHATGFRIAVDDFGTGYSNLANIRNFALDCIKIDKSFVDDLGERTRSTAIVSTIAHLARGLGLSVVAEGVESEAQCQALRLVGCSHLQGYLFGAGQSAEAARRRAVAALAKLPQVEPTLSIIRRTNA